MPDAEKYEILVLGSGEAGKWTAWTMADQGRRTAMVERKWLGGSCPNIACLPSKNVIYSARIASLARRGAEFGLEMDQLRINMAGVQQRKRKMVEEEHQFHAKRTADAGIELIMGEGRFVAPGTVEVALNDGGTRRIFGERVFLDLGSHSAMPDVPGLAAANPMTHIEVLDLDRLPRHLIVIGGGYIGLELAQAVRRFGSKVTVIERGAQLAEREDPDVGAALLELFHDEGIEVILGTQVSKVEGLSGKEVRVYAKDGPGERIIEGTDLLGFRRSDAEYERNRTGASRRRARRARLYQGQRPAGDDRIKRVGDGRLRGQSAIHTRRVPRLPRRTGQLEGWQSNHQGSHRAVLHVHRSGTGARGPQRDRGEARQNRISSR